MKRVLWWLLAGSKGGANRARIIMTLNERPYNANQLTELLKLDYKTVRHHLDVLVKNNVLETRGQRYGTMYFLSQPMEEHYSDFAEIWERIGKNEFKNGKDSRGDKDDK